ncbi:MAG: hypothetical protein U9N59_03015 [Campylobacterota bacterium]|nr:hypothetical protein [Campylobacterota bacterium]
MDINQIENRIYTLAKKQNQLALKKLLENEDGIVDYKLVVKIYFYTNENKIHSHIEDLKPCFLNDINCGSLFKIDNISEITNIDFDINISYQYKINIRTT